MSVLKKRMMGGGSQDSVSRGIVLGIESLNHKVPRMDQVMAGKGFAFPGGIVIGGSNLPMELSAVLARICGQPILRQATNEGECVVCDFCLDKCQLLMVSIKKLYEQMPGKEVAWESQKKSPNIATG